MSAAGTPQSALARTAGAAGAGHLAGLADEELVARAQARDVAAFEELLGRYESRVYRVVIRLLRDETDTREVLQETFLSVWRKLPGFEGKAQFGSWLYRVAVNAALMLLRSRRRRPEVPADDLDPDVLGRAAAAAGSLGADADWTRRPDEQFQSQELRQHIEAAVDALPASLRAVFLVRDVEGLSTEETAEVMGLSVPNVKTRLHRARLSLREAIAGYFART